MRAVKRAFREELHAGLIDAALSRTSRFLYTLNNGAHEIEGFAVHAHGSLDSLGAVGDLPAGAVASQRPEILRGGGLRPPPLPHVPPQEGSSAEN